MLLSCFRKKMSANQVPRALRHFSFMNDLWALIVSHWAKSHSNAPSPRKGNFAAEGTEKEIGEGITKSGRKKES